MKLHRKLPLGIFLLFPLGCIAQETAKYSLPKLGDPLGTRFWTIADFDGDGKMDLLTSSPALSGGEGYLHDLFLRFDSNAEAHFQVSSDSSRLNLIAWDVDGDQDLDLLVTSTVSNRLLSIWINDGKGHFTPGEVGRFQDCSPVLGSDQISNAPLIAPQLLLQSQERTGDSLPGKQTSFFMPLGATAGLWSPSDLRDTTIAGPYAERAPPSVL